MPPLDELAARAVTRAWLLERALHDAGPWTVCWGGHEVPARRVLNPADSQIAFYAVLPDPRAGGGPAALRSGGELVSMIDLDLEGLPAGEFEIEWVLAYREPVAA